MDLSLKHEPVSELFGVAGATAKPVISEDLAEAFERDGFITRVPLLSGGQVDALRGELEGLMRAEQSENPFFYEYNLNELADGERTLFHALGAWRVSPAFHDLIFFDPLVNCAERLLGGPVRLWHDQLFVKPAHDGSVVAWHQDYSYWTRTVPLAHLTCWIALGDSNEENGCVQHVPGSHRWHLLPRGDLASDMNAVFKHLNADQMVEFKPVPSILKAGEASFHHPMTVHGSYENNSDRPRSGVVINFMRDGVRSNSYEPLLDGVPLIPMGEKLEGQFFPLLSRGNGTR